LVEESAFIANIEDLVRGKHRKPHPCRYRKLSPA
jgi:hypothetical protein